MEIPLAMLNEDVEARIVKVLGGKGLVKRLSDLGFTPGAKVKILLSKGFGPMVVDVRGSRIALGRGILMKIIVTPEVDS